MSISINFQSQRGVFLPLVAAIAMGVFFVMVILGIDTNRIRAAQTDLNSKLDVICGDVSHTPGNYSETLAKFQEHVKRLVTQNQIKYSRIDSVDLYLPTMPSGGGFAFKGGRTFVVGDLGSNPVAPSPVCNFMAGSQTIACRIHGSAYNNDSGNPSNDPDFPPDLWNNLENAGNSVGCVVNATAKTFLLGTVQNASTQLRAKSVWWSPLRAHRPIYDNNDPQGTSAGLTIGIGTQMFTSFFDARFRFMETGGPPRAFYDPRLSPNFVPFQAATAAHSFNSNNTLSGYLPLNIGTSLWGNTLATPSIGDDTTTISFESDLDNNSPLPKPSDVDSMLVSCMNPAVLVRNAFLSTIVELASRNGQLRNMTEILHMNPLHRDINFFQPSIISNPPAKIVGFGQDLTSPSFQLPFISYHSGFGDLSEVPVSPATAGVQLIPGVNYSPIYSKNGWINPFFDPAAPPAVGSAQESWLNHHALISSQLRYCYNLYLGQIAAAKGLERYKEFQTFLNEPSYYPSVFDFPNQPGGTGSNWPAIKPGVSPSKWDQDCPWKGGNTPNNTPSCTRVANSTLLNAAEVMTALGTTQMCPYTVNDANIFTPQYTQVGGGAPLNPCPLTEDPTNVNSNSYELQPDILGLLKYWNNQAGFRAIQSPGIFPIQNAVIPAVEPSEPFCVTPGSCNNYAQNSNSISSLLLVLHEPGVDASLDLGGRDIVSPQIAAISNEVQTMITNMAADIAPLRPITIVYIPTNYRDNLAISTLATTFTANPGGAPVTPNTFFSAESNGVTSPIALYNISPYDRFWGARCGIFDSTSGITGASSDDAVRPPVNPDGSLGGVPEWQIFQLYWNCLLTQPSKSISGIAYNIFSERILSRELKF
jgi:hypothetical protein